MYWTSVAIIWLSHHKTLALEKVYNTGRTSFNLNIIQLQGAYSTVFQRSSLHTSSSTSLSYYHHCLHYKLQVSIIYHNLNITLENLYAWKACHIPLSHRLWYFGKTIGIHREYKIIHKHNIRLCSQYKCRTWGTVVTNLSHIGAVLSTKLSLWCIDSCISFFPALRPPLNQPENKLFASGFSWVHWS